MQARARSLAETLALLALTTCAAGRPQVLTFRDERVGPCTDGKPCELAGTLTLDTEPDNRTTASIDQVQGPCVPLLIPADLSAHRKQWEGKRVRITGTALTRARVPMEVTAVQYRDRWLLEGVCGKSDIVVYTDRIVRER